jgi:hypothetical protein
MRLKRDIPLCKDPTQGFKFSKKLRFLGLTPLVTQVCTDKEVSGSYTMRINAVGAMALITVGFFAARVIMTIW